MKWFFKLLMELNKVVLPSYAKKDPATLNNFQKAVLGFRYWVLMKALK